ncbi:TRAP transporter small permease [Propionivibrio dicarboxylicus]|uniref:TRAP transporter small permease protein n=1 Tax=Propionivibrio dicarboxylicus TaxID=83767 RepID=A0A1G8EY21_9RHOO|nr:TRAP transporter small permease subunit [Propionivibrio dicarboxylicus]SDH74629.1 TRAP-type C4-dicarboxylate transport system, small permease component [Propionivibrio dicarboxylicus]
MRRWEGALSGVLQWLVMVLCIVIFVLVIVLVALRYLFNTTIVGANEAGVMLFIYTTALGGAVDIARSRHIIVDTFVNCLSARVRRIVDGTNLVIVGMLNAFLFKYSIDWVGAVGGSEHPVLHVPEGLVQVAMPIGCAFSVLFCVTRLVTMFASNSEENRGAL